MEKGMNLHIPPNQPFELKQCVTHGKPGILVPINIGEINKKLKLVDPFKMDRLFYINDTDLDGTDDEEENENEDGGKNMRGLHANKYIREIMVCMNGSCDVNLFNGKCWTNYKLKRNQYIYISENIWVEYGNFNDQCLLMVLVQDLDKTVKDNKAKIHNMDEYINYVSHKLS